MSVCPSRPVRSNVLVSDSDCVPNPVDVSNLEEYPDIVTLASLTPSGSASFMLTDSLATLRYKVIVAVSADVVDDNVTSLDPINESVTLLSAKEIMPDANDARDPLWAIATKV